MTNVLVVYKKNFESIHDESLAQLEAILEEMKTTHQLRVELRARERVRRADFIGRDLVIVLGGDGTLTSISHNIDENTLVMGVNSHPIDDDVNGSVGFYMDSTLDKLCRRFLRCIKRGRNREQSSSIASHHRFNIRKSVYHRSSNE